MYYEIIMVLGHIANTYVVQNVAKRYNLEFNLYFLLFGAYLPDLIDKPLNILFQLPGRGIAHSVIIQALLFSPLIYSLPKYRKTFLSVWFGCILHLIQDTIALSIAFWPVVGSLSDYRRFSFGESFYTYYILVKYPYTLFAEVISFVIAGGILLSKWLPEDRELAEEKVRIDKEDYKY
jgi:hypothetical protein